MSSLVTTYYEKLRVHSLNVCKPGQGVTSYVTMLIQNETV